MVISTSTADQRADAVFDFDDLGTTRSIGANESFSAKLTFDTDEPVIREVLLKTSPPGWDLVSVECDDAESTSISGGSVSDGSATYRVEPGEAVRCDFAFSSGGPGDGPEGPGDGPGSVDEDSQRLLPLPGEWRVVNVSAAMVCGGQTIDLAKSPPGLVALEVRRGGDRLIGTGTHKSRNKQLTLNAKGEDRFEGKRKEKTQGKNVTFKYTYRVVSPQKMVGSATAKIKAQGANCTFTRRFEMTYQGPG